MPEIVPLPAECKKLCKLITLNKYLLDEVIDLKHSSQTTTKSFGNLSILPTQLIKKDTFSWIWRSSVQVPLMYEQTSACK